MPSIVSIIVPLFNRAYLVTETIDSVLSQSCGRWEMLIVDDHSTDRSIEAAKISSKSDPRIKVWKRRGDSKGAPACRNEGLAAAAGDYVIFLDSDDLLSHDCVENRISAYASEPEFDFHLFPSEQFRKQPGDLGLPWFRHADDALTGFLKQPLWQTTAAIWKTESIRSLGGFREDLLAWQDWDLFVRSLIQEKTFKVHRDAAPDNFIRRSSHDRISLHAARAKECLKNRVLLFRDLHLNLCDAGMLNESRRAGVRDLFVRLATQMHISKMPKAADEWIVEIHAFGLVSDDEIEEVRKIAIQRSRLSFKQRVNEWKVWALKMSHRIADWKKSK